MNGKRAIVAGVLLVFVFALAAAPVQSLAQTRGKPAPQQQQQQQQKIFIPKEIQAQLEQGLAARQGIQDVPFDIIDHYFFPAMQNYHVAFLFKAKNSAFGYAPAAATPEAPAVEGQVQAPVNIFLQFRQFENDQPSRVIREVYVPAAFTTAADFDPEAEDWYSTGYPLAAGRYLLAMAITSPDLKRVGVDYYEFSIEDMTALQNALATNTLFLVKSMEQVQQPEDRTQAHRGFFTYSVLHIVPNLDHVIAPGETIEVFFYVFGAQAQGAEPGQPGKVSLEVAFEVKKAEETVLRWEPQTYDYALISQPLPMKQTVLIKDEKGERTEQRDLEPGPYQMIIKLKDKISNAELTKTIDFEVK